jgi:hypothetical protein
MSPSNSSVSSRCSGRQFSCQFRSPVGADVFLGGHGVVVLLDFQLVGVDGDIGAGELLQSAGVVQVQVTHDHGADVADAVAGRGQGVI